MQNLSLQVTQTAPLKKLTDAANKSNESADKPVSADPSTSFQMMLSKQVQAKQASAHKLPAKEITASQGNAGHAAIEQKSKPKAGNNRPETVSEKQVIDESISIDANPIGNSGTVPIAQVELDSSAFVITKEDADTDIKPEDFTTNVADTNVNVLAASTLSPIVLSPIALAPLVNAIPLVNTQGTSAPPVANTGLQLASTPEAATQKQQSLDTVLSNALSQSKNTSTSEKDTQAFQATGDARMQSEQTRWLDVSLTSAAKQALGDEAASTKLVLNAIKDGVNRNTAINDIVMPASYQPAAQTNAAVAMQQAGSTNSINVYPGKTGWDQAISQKVVWMVGAGEQSATLTLNPPDLGPLQVVINVHNDKANTTFISDNAEVRQALQDGMSNLRDKMSESGIALGQVNVSSGEQSQQQFQQATQNRLPTQLNNGASASQVEQATSVSTLVRVANGLVDTFA